VLEELKQRSIPRESRRASRAQGLLLRGLPNPFGTSPFPLQPPLPPLSAP